MLKTIISIICVMCMAIVAVFLENVTYVCWFGFLYIGNEIAMIREADIGKDK